MFPDIKDNNIRNSKYNGYDEIENMVKARLKQINYYSGSGEHTTALVEFVFDSRLSG